MKKKILIIFLSIILVASFAGCESTQSPEEVKDDTEKAELAEEKTEEEAEDEAEEETEEELPAVRKIKMITNMLGQSVSEDGVVNLNDKVRAFFDDADLFGYSGTVGANYEEYLISTMIWTSNEQYGESAELEDIVSNLEEIYGQYNSKNDEYEDLLQDAYVWNEDVPDCDVVACGFSASDNNGTILICWMDNLNDENFWEGNESKGEQYFLNNLKNNEFLYDGYLALMDILKYKGTNISSAADALSVDNQRGYTMTVPGDFFGVPGTYKLSSDSWHKVNSFSFYPDEGVSFDQICDVITELYGEYTTDNSDEKGQEYHWDTDIHLCSFRLYDKVYSDGSGGLLLGITLNYLYNEINPSFKSGSEDEEDVSEKSSSASSGGSSTSRSSSGGSSGSGTTHTCAASGCNKTGTYSIIGISGEKEYYCAEHYAELNAMEDSMENSVGTTHTCAVSGCNKTGTRSIVGISGQREYYCETHYKEMQNTVDKMLGE